MRLEPDDERYPARLLALDEPPPLTVSGPLVGERVVAIVGSRQADEGGRRFAHALAYHFAQAGFVVVSGGAAGIDQAAHRGAARGGGVTWVVACTGYGAEPYPPAHKAMFERIARSKRSRMIWPLPDGTGVSRATPRYRNGVLVALADLVIVLQARIQSGSLNAATWAAGLGRPLYIAPGAPWDTRFGGSTSLLLGGARPLWSIDQLFRELALPPPNLADGRAGIRGELPQQVPVRDLKKRAPRPRKAPQISFDQADWSEEETVVYSHISKAPTQQDKIIANTGLGASSTVTALLTLSLKDVVVEGPDGFFRRKSA